MKNFKNRAYLWYILEQLLLSMYEVFVKLPGVMGVCCRCCSRPQGRSWGHIEIVMVEIKFGAQQINIKRILIVKTWYAIRSSIQFNYLKIFWLQRVSEILWSEKYYYLSK